MRHSLHTKEITVKKRITPFLVFALQVCTLADSPQMKVAHEELSFYHCAHQQGAAGDGSRNHFLFITNEQASTTVYVLTSCKLPEISELFF